MAKLQPPKDLVLSLLPLLVGKAILLIFELKITDKLKTVIEISTFTTVGVG